MLTTTGNMHNDGLSTCTYDADFKGRPEGLPLGWAAAWCAVTP